MDPKLQALVDELEQGILFLKNQATSKLAAVEAAHPEASHVEVLAAYEDEVRAALPSLSLMTVMTVAQRSYMQLRSGKSGFNRNHAGLG